MYSEKLNGTYFISRFVNYMVEYHLRQSKKEILDESELTEIILGQKTLTMALCKNNEPYISTVNYYYNPEEKYFYFHCSPRGKKIDYIKSNPLVWGQILEDLGFIEGECDHAYRSVQFKGIVELIEDRKAKIKALTSMKEQIEGVATDEWKDRLNKRDLDEVAIGKIIIQGMSGKKNP